LVKNKIVKIGPQHDNELRPLFSTDFDQEYRQNYFLAISVGFELFGNDYYNELLKQRHSPWLDLFIDLLLSFLLYIHLSLSAG